VTEATKHDSTKAPLALIPTSALIEEAHVLAFGAHKYGTHNWRQGLAWSKLISAILRHITAFNAGEDFDQESGLHHLAHVRVSCAFLLEYMSSHPELDDRYITPKLIKEREESVFLFKFFDRCISYDRSKEPPWLAAFKRVS